jgi:hypothetical protein
MGQNDRQTGTDRQTGGQMQSKPIVPPGFTGRGLIMLEQGFLVVAGNDKLTLTTMTKHIVLNCGNSSRAFYISISDLFTPSD